MRLLCSSRAVLRRRAENRVLRRRAENRILADGDPRIGFLRRRAENRILADGDPKLGFLRRRAENRILADVLQSLENSVGLMASADSTTIQHHGSDGLEDALTAQFHCHFSADEDLVTLHCCHCCICCISSSLIPPAPASMWPMCIWCCGIWCCCICCIRCTCSSLIPPTPAPK